MLQFEVGGEISLRDILKVSHLSRKNLFQYITGKEKHFRFSVSEAESKKVQKYFKNIPCPFHVHGDKLLYAFRPDLRIDEKIDMSLPLSNPESHAGAFMSEKIARHPLPALSIVEKRVPTW